MSKKNYLLTRLGILHQKSIAVQDLRHFAFLIRTLRRAFPNLRFLALKSFVAQRSGARSFSQKAQ
ncbi:MAG TPA: hypothetical protein DCX32_02785 [Candidatus Moranbacteria bacterium]|nr:hypothetical protein [Candidatus Moranbacteria bacterium]